MATYKGYEFTRVQNNDGDDTEWYTLTVGTIPAKGGRRQLAEWKRIIDELGLSR